MTQFTPFKWDLMVLLAAAEATYGVDPGLTGASNSILAFNVDVKPMMGQDVERTFSQPFFHAPQKFGTGFYQQITFETELVGASVAGTSPGWAPIMKAAGFAETIVANTSVTYNPISTNIGSCTVNFFRDGVLHKLTGCRFNGKIVASTHGLPRIQWTGLGLFTKPTAQANPVPSFAAFQQPQVVNANNTPVFTVNAQAIPMQTFELDFGNKVSYRELVNYRSVDLTDRAPAITSQLQAVPLSAFDPFSIAMNQSAVAISLQHGLGAGQMSTLTVPNARLHRPEGYNNQDKVVMQALNFDCLPTVGNDDFTLMLN